MRECVVVEAVRTPTGKSGWKGMEKAGQFANVSAQDLIGAAIETLVKNVREKCSAFDPKEIEDVAIGCAAQIGEQAGNLGRLSALIAGLPHEVAGWTIDRYCNAGLQAINSQAQAIMCGCGDIMIAGGVEQMSHYPMGTSVSAIQKAGYPVMFSKKLMKIGAFLTMGMAAEKVAEKYNLSREESDRFGLWSHQKAVRAMRNDAEYRKKIAPVVIEGKKGEPPKVIDRDEPPRAEALDNPDGAYEKIKKLEPRFKKVVGTVTPGNSSAIVDGAAACMLMSREKADKLGIKPMARIVSMAVAGSDPVIMLLGPIPAMKKAFARSKLTMKDMDVFEPNEAFASPVLAFCKEFNVAYDDPRINPTGGAIALGHPIGASGVMYFAEMVHWLNNRGLRYGIETLCGGGGVGIATIVERIK